MNTRTAGKLKRESTELWCWMKQRGRGMLKIKKSDFELDNMALPNKSVNHGIWLIASVLISVPIAQVNDSEKVLPVIYYDFNSSHPDFEQPN
jgi:hypothetical protein